MASDSKRKAPRQLQKIGIKRTKSTISKRHTISKAHIKPFRLFDLPAELRNVVYEKIAEEQTARIRSAKVLLSDGSGLVKAGPELRDEYLPILLLHASKIEARVHDFEFGPVITVLNQLSSAEINALPTVTHPGTRKIEIQLFINYGLAGMLKRWLNRAGHGEKKGTMLDISYKVMGRTPYNRKFYDAWVAVLDDYIEEALTERAVSEARKIKAALEN
jgi:hypothetical protein